MTSVSCACTAAAWQTTVLLHSLQACPAGTIPAGVPINILGSNGYPLRNDNTTNLAYVGNGDGSTPPEQYVAYHPQDPNSRLAIQPGGTAVLLNLQTGLYCRLVPVPAGYPLSVPLSVPLPGGRRAWSSAPPGVLTALDVTAQLLPPSCATFGVVCHQPSAATGTVLTYNGYGMSYQGVPLVQTPGTATLILSNATECTVPSGGRLSFPLAPLQSPRPPPPALVVTGESVALPFGCPVLPW
jgi:hypothetical protein